MLRLVAIGTLLALALSGLRADDKPGRAEQLKAIRADYAKAHEDFGKGIKDGTIKRNAEDEYPGWADVLKRLVKPTRLVIDADPADALGLEALLFALGALEAADADLFALALKHHAASEKIKPLLGLDAAPTEFLRKVAERSPHIWLRLRAAYHLADREYAAGKPDDAEKLLEDLQRNPAFWGLRSNDRWLGDRVETLFYEVRYLNVGDVPPEVTGDDLDGKPFKLSDSRGKVTLLIFWAAYRRPCLDTVGHGVELAARYAGRPFTVVGVNGDPLPGGNLTVHGTDGKPVDGTAKLKALVQTNKITWRSFRHGQFGAGEDTGIGDKWNVNTWPTAYLLDEAGVIRGKWKGTPTKELDAAIEKLVKATEAK